MNSFILTRKKSYEADNWLHEYWEKELDTPLYNTRTGDTMTDRQFEPPKYQIYQYRQRYSEGFLSRQCKQQLSETIDSDVWGCLNLQISEIERMFIYAFENSVKNEFQEKIAQIADKYRLDPQGLSAIILYILRTPVISSSAKYLAEVLFSRGFQSFGMSMNYRLSVHDMLRFYQTLVTENLCTEDPLVPSY